MSLTNERNQERTMVRHSEIPCKLKTCRFLMVFAVEACRKHAQTSRKCPFYIFLLALEAVEEAEVVAVAKAKA